MLGAAWRVNLGLPDRRLRETPEQVRPIVECIRRCRPRGDRAAPRIAIGTRIMWPRTRLVAHAAFNSGLRRFDAAGAPWKPDWLVCYFINNSRRAVVRHRRLATTTSETARAGVSSFAVRACRRRCGTDAPDVTAVSAARRKSRRAVRRPRRRPVGGRLRRPRAAGAAPPSSAARRAAGRHRENRHRLLRIGRRQRHRRDGTGDRAGRRAATRSTCSAARCRSGFPPASGGVAFQRVATPAYPLFREPQYALSLANEDRAGLAALTISTSSTRTTPCRTRPPRISRGRSCAAHADRSRAEDDDDPARHGHHARRQRSVVSETVAFCIDQSDGVTAVSESLRADTCVLAR